MIIVITIIGIITIVVITSQGSFNKSIILSNAAYDVALAVRSTEGYGLGSKVTTGLLNNTGYGLEFTLDNKMTQFADSIPATVTGACHPVPVTGVDSPDAKVGDCIYTAGQDQVVTTYTLNNGITISKICAFNGSWTCTPALTHLDVTFVRPDPTPFMTMNGQAYTGTLSQACITLASPQGTTRVVSINWTGEVDASAATCP